jgi:hypothetical protein
VTPARSAAYPKQSSWNGLAGVLPAGEGGPQTRIITVLTCLPAGEESATVDLARA